jgi:hypothetical protein
MNAPLFLHASFANLLAAGNEFIFGGREFLWSFRRWHQVLLGGYLIFGKGM